MQPYDLIVIGSGPGGQRAAIQGAKAGKRAAIIEKQIAIGGACINSGTIPSKTMREAVLHLSGFYDKSFYGSSYTGKDSITMADIQAGDHIMVRGGMANNVFQPKSVMVISPEQWKRFQESGMGGAGGQTAKPPQDNSKPQNPPEPPH